MKPQIKEEKGSLLERLNRIWQDTDLDGWGYLPKNKTIIMDFKANFYDDLILFINKWTDKSKEFCEKLNCNNSPLTIYMHKEDYELEDIQNENN
jgi:hypothetical protein